MSTILPSASFPDLALAKVLVQEGRHLPRWEANGAIYHVSLHLADSVPQAQLEIWRAERRRLSELAKSADRPLTEEEVVALRAVYDEHVEKYLSAGFGECLLKDSRAAAVVEKTVTHGNGTLYALHEWCVMPNHLHVIVGGFGDARPMRDVLETWKRVMVHRINKALTRDGEVWHRDAYTRIIRNRAEYARQMSYVWNNPESAGLDAGFRRKRYARG